MQCATSIKVTTMEINTPLTIASTHDPDFNNGPNAKLIKKPRRAYEIIATGIALEQLLAARTSSSVFPGYVTLIQALPSTLGEYHSAPSTWEDTMPTTAPRTIVNYAEFNWSFGEGDCRESFSRSTTPLSVCTQRPYQTPLISLDGTPKTELTPKTESLAPSCIAVKWRF